MGKGKNNGVCDKARTQPARVRWRRSASGVGRLFKDIFRASIGAYDSGLIEGINKNIEHSVTCRRSMGAKVCELILRRRN